MRYEVYCSLNIEEYIDVDAEDQETYPNMHLAMTLFVKNAVCV